MKQVEFDLGVPIVEQPTLPSKEEPNPMCRKVGYGPENTTCKNCVHLVRKVVHSEAKFYKCAKQMKKVGNSYEGKDYRLKWNSCRLYEEKEKE